MTLTPHVNATPTDPQHHNRHNPDHRERMARLLAVVLAAVAGAVGVQAFLARPMVPHTGAVQQPGAEGE